jgi:hypothetical protein
VFRTQCFKSSYLYLRFLGAARRARTVRPMPPRFSRDLEHGPGAGSGLLPWLPPPTCSRPVSGVGLGLFVEASNVLVQLSHMRSTLDHELSPLSWKWSHVCPFGEWFSILFLCDSIQEQAHAACGHPAFLAVSEVMSRGL